MRTLFLATVIFFYSFPSLAQDKTVDKKFIFATVFLTGATMLDVESTFAALDNCNHTCKEGNPVMRPLLNSGRPAVYVVEGAVDVGLMAWSYKMKKDGNKLWWLFPVVVGVTHAVAGGINMRFVF